MRIRQFHVLGDLWKPQAWNNNPMKPAFSMSTPMPRESSGVNSPGSKTSCLASNFAIWLFVFNGSAVRLTPRWQTSGKNLWNDTQKAKEYGANQEQKFDLDFGSSNKRPHWCRCWMDGKPRKCCRIRRAGVCNHHRVCVCAELDRVRAVISESYRKVF